MVGPVAAPPARRAPWIGLALAALIIVTSLTLPHLLGWEVYARKNPSEFGTIEPLHGFWSPRWFGPGTLPAIVLAVLAYRYADSLAQRLSWRWLMLTAYAASLTWMLALAFTDGLAGVAHVFANGHEYFTTAQKIDDTPGMLDEFIERIPYAHPDNWVVHIAGHPPGAFLYFIALVRLGISDPLWVGLITTALGATSVIAVLTTMRTLGAGTAARRVAPLLALSPAAIFVAVSADGLFAAVAAWGMCALAGAATAGTPGRIAGLATVAGLLLGYTVMMSYGLPLMGVLAIAVLILARGSWAPLPIAAAAALLVVMIFAWAGFAWWEAYPVLVERYWDGVAKDRPFTYWVWGNIGALLISAGPMVGSGVALLVAVPRRDVLNRDNTRVVLWLAGAAVVMILVADLSRMSKAEVERIWLPFIPWLTLSLALLPQRWLRPALGLQLATALIIETLLYTSW